MYKKFTLKLKMSLLTQSIYKNSELIVVYRMKKKYLIVISIGNFAEK